MRTFSSTVNSRRRGRFKFDETFSELGEPIFPVSLKDNSQSARHKCWWDVSNSRRREGAGCGRLATNFLHSDNRCCSETFVAGISGSSSLFEDLKTVFESSQKGGLDDEIYDFKATANS